MNELQGTERDRTEPGKTGQNGSVFEFFPGGEDVTRTSLMDANWATVADCGDKRMVANPGPGAAGQVLMRL